MRETRHKEKTITLVTTKGLKQEFGIQHAERLLDLGPEVNGGWSIDPNSEYTYTEEDGIKLKSSKGNTAKA